MAEGRADRVDGVEPDEVWLSDGGLLVLKGGMATGPEQASFPKQNNPIRIHIDKNLYLFFWILMLK